MPCPSGDDDAHLSALTGPSFKLFEDLRHELQDNMDLRTLHDSMVTDRGEPWHVVGGLILRGSYVFMPTTSTSLQVVLQLAHSVGLEGM
jgi:hypothetical protein